jgi:hypothetical protein
MRVRSAFLVAFTLAGLVAVGDRQKIEAYLAQLNLGAIELRDTEGNVVKP